MDRRIGKAVTACAVCVVLLIACTHLAFTLSARQATAARRIPIYQTRQMDTDLEVTGMIAGLPEGSRGYVRYADLASLPKISGIVNDRNVLVTGVYLDEVARALGVFRDSDLIDATCADNYRAHYPSSYIAAHHPILSLTIDHLKLATWAAHMHRVDPGPYFITHANFKPSFKILAHENQPQVPTNIVRLDFSTTASIYGAIAPRGSFSATSPEELGFVIAKENCLRCHNQGQYGGSKSGRTWTMLSTWAREQPAYFSAYVRNPKSFESHAKMPGNPEYDAATLAALTAYFRTFTALPADSSR
jgi:hypothetical protein